MPRSVKNEMNTVLMEAGLDAETAEAVVEIDGLMQKWRRRAQKRELGQRALVHLKIELDLAQLDVLFAIAGPMDPAEAPGETMVATVAERVNIDPSRASRLVSDMVDQGYARRAVSQADARRTIIELTERGQAVVEAVRAYKFLVMGDFLGEWSAEDLTLFVPLLKRFGTWMDSIDPASEKHADEIAALAEGIARAGVQEPA
ncbi:MAG: MarR family winged helix-turn-helix transcriptional regulator [Devosia sp.]